jgi:hypothetical protein
VKGVPFFSFGANACGVIAIGFEARGIVAIGFVSYGVVAIGVGAGFGFVATGLFGAAAIACVTLMGAAPFAWGPIAVSLLGSPRGGLSLVHPAWGLLAWFWYMVGWSGIHRPNERRGKLAHPEGFTRAVVKDGVLELEDGRTIRPANPIQDGLHLVKIERTVSTDETSYREAPEVSWRVETLPPKEPPAGWPGLSAFLQKLMVGMVFFSFATAIVRLIVWLV